MTQGGEGAALVFHKPEQVVNGNQIYLGKRMKRIPLALSLSFVCWPNSPVVSLFTDYKVPKGLRLWMSDLNDDFPSACRRQQQQSVVSLQLLYKHVSGVKKCLRELCLTFQTSIHRPDANCGLDGASMRHRCATRVYTSIMQYKK